MQTNIISSEAGQDVPETFGTTSIAKPAANSLVSVDAPGVIPAGTSNDRTSDVVALEFPPCRGRGRRRPDTLAALAERDRLLRQWASRFLPDASHAAAARIIYAELSRYCASGWRFERTAEQVPSRHRGRPRELAWMILCTKDNIPAERSIRRTLASEHYSWPATRTNLDWTITMRSL